MAVDKGYWKPNRRQEPFLELPLTIFEAFYGGGAGSGKSDVLLMYGIANEWHKNPRFKQVFQRRTYPELKAEIVPRSREIYTKLGAWFNKTDMVWTFPREDQFGTGVGHSNNGGALIFLGHCENEDDVHKYDSMEINLYTPDELTSFTKWIYTYIAFQRVRTSDPVLPAIVRSAGMPGGIGHNFVKERFVAPYPEGGKVIIGKGGIKRFYVHATAADNPHVDPGYLARMEGIPSEAERKAKKFGDWDSYQGQVFEEFRDKKFDDEPDNAIHVIEPFDIPHWWPKFIVIDWGFAAMAYVAFYAVSPNKRLYVYREFGWLKTKIEEWAPVIKDFVEREEPKVIKVCKSAGQDRGQEHTIQQQIETALGQSVELSNNSPGSRVAGKMLMHEYFRWKPKPVVPPGEMPIYSEEHAQWIMRNKGMQAYQDYLDIFIPPEEETNIPKAQIFRCNDNVSGHEGHPNCCPLLIESIKACNYDKPKNNKPAEDVAEFEGDDPYDNFRYGCDTAERYFEEAGEEFKKVQRQAAIIAQLNATQDWTAFYRNMRTIESAESQQMVPMFRRRR